MQTRRTNEPRFRVTRGGPIWYKKISILSKSAEMNRNRRKTNPCVGIQMYCWYEIFKGIDRGLWVLNNGKGWFPNRKKYSSPLNWLMSPAWDKTYQNIHNTKTLKHKYGQYYIQNPVNLWMYRIIYRIKLNSFEMSCYLIMLSIFDIQVTKLDIMQRYIICYNITAFPGS